MVTQDGKGNLEGFLGGYTRPGRGFGRLQGLPSSHVGCGQGLLMDRESHPVCRGLISGPASDHDGALPSHTIAGSVEDFPADRHQHLKVPNIKLPRPL